MESAQLYFEDFKPGDRTQCPSKTVTDAHFLFFAGLTGDSHPIHYDTEYAKGTRFGARVTHGLLLTAMTALGASPLSSRLEASMIAFVEQSSRFLAPVLIGDTISPTLEVIRLERKGEKGLVTFKCTITNQRGVTVLEGHHTYLVKCREPRAGDNR